MKWAWALLAAGLGIAALCASALRSTDRGPHSVLVSDDLVAALDSLADTASVEHYRCLLGVRLGDSLLVLDNYAPKIAHADYNTVTPAERCVGPTVGTWHNHIPYNVPMNDPHNRATPVEPWSVCEMSKADRFSGAILAAAHAPLTMISVENGVHCAWLHVTEGDSVGAFVRLPWAVP